MNTKVKRSPAELDVHPDQDRLDDEWVAQPRLRLRYGTDLADARRELAQAKAELEVTDAELAQDVRTRPERYGLEKVTENAVKELVPTIGKHQDARSRVVEAQHEVDVLDAVVSAVDQKKSALENLVRLFLAGYYGEPRAPEGAKDAMDDAAKRAVRRRGRREESDE